MRPSAASAALALRCCPGQGPPAAARCSGVRRRLRAAGWRLGPAGRGGRRVEEGLQLGPGDADFAALAPGGEYRGSLARRMPFTRLKLAADSSAGGGTRGRGVNGLEEQRCEGDDGREGAGHEPGE